MKTIQLLLFPIFLLFFSAQLYSQNNNASELDNSLILEPNEEVISDVDILAVGDSINTIPLVAYWKVGDTLRYKKSQWKDKTKNLDLDLSSTATMIVVEETDGSYLVNWTYELSDQMKLMMKMFSDAFQETIDKGMELDILTNEMGEFINLENWEDIRNSALQVGEDVAESMFGEEEGNSKKSKKKKSKRKKKEATDSYEDEVDPQSFMNSMMENMYANAESTLEHAAPELSLYYAYYGSEYNANSRIAYDADLPNPLSGKMMSTTGEVSVILDAENPDLVHFVDSIAIGKEELNKATKEVLDQLSPDSMEYDIQQAMNDLEMEATVVTRNTYQISTGLLLEIRYEKTFSAIDKSGEMEPENSAEGFLFKLIE